MYGDDRENSKKKKMYDEKRIENEYVYILYQTHFITIYGDAQNVYVHAI